MKVRSLRLISNDKHHNTFTDACWFQESLYVAFGRAILMSSRRGQNRRVAKP